MPKKLVSLFICLLCLLPLLSPLTGKAVGEEDPFGEIRYALCSANTTPLVDTATTLYLDFSAEAVAAIPSVRYEWFKDGELLPAVTGTRLSLKKAQLSDGGEYTVRITLKDGDDTKVIECGTLTLRVFTKTDLTIAILIGLLLFSIPLLSLATVCLVRRLKKKKAPQ